MQHDFAQGVFAGLEDEHAGPASLRTAGLDDARRGFVPIRKVFAQRPQAERHRPSVPGAMVHARMVLPLRLLLLAWAFGPILKDSQWPLTIWAQLVAGTTTPPPSVASVARAFASLERLKLITSLEKTPQWYGISERAADRDNKERAQGSILLTHIQATTDRKMCSATALRMVLPRTLAPPTRQPRATSCRPRPAARRAVRPSHTSAPPRSRPRARSESDPR